MKHSMKTPDSSPSYGAGFMKPAVPLYPGAFIVWYAEPNRPHYHER